MEIAGAMGRRAVDQLAITDIHAPREHHFPVRDQQLAVGPQIDAEAWWQEPQRHETPELDACLLERADHGRQAVAYSDIIEKHADTAAALPG